jgi:uncharacterized membrane protein YkoI
MESRLQILNRLYLSAEKAKQITLESIKDIAARDHDTKCVLEQIEKEAKSGSYEITVYNDDKVRNNLTLLGYNCSKPFNSWNSIYMKVSWL